MICEDCENYKKKKKTLANIMMNECWVSSCGTHTFHYPVDFVKMERVAKSYYQEHPEEIGINTLKLRSDYYNAGSKNAWEDCIDEVLREYDRWFKHFPNEMLPTFYRIRKAIEQLGGEK